MTNAELTAIREAAKSTLDDNSDTCLAARKNAMNVLALLDEVARVTQERDVTHEYLRSEVDRLTCERDEARVECSKMKDHIAVLNDALNVTRAECERQRQFLSAMVDAVCAGRGKYLEDATEQARALLRAHAALASGKGQP